MNSYEKKQQARRERLEAAADRAKARADSHYQRADLREEVSGIPLGQPILIGHHSEGRHRRAIARADSAMRKSIDEGNRAKDLRAKAASVGLGGISSDDPDAIRKLSEKLDRLEEKQANMKAANRVIKSWAKKGVTHETQGADFDAYAAALTVVCSDYGRAIARELIQPQWGNSGPVGFAPYQLSNNNAEIKRLKMRIAKLEKAQNQETVRQSYQGVCEVVENAEVNRLQFVFEGKPSAEARAIMKAHGFRWAPSQGAWQRQLTPNARYSARLALKALSVSE
ncbi:hypothetical protein PhaeoP24_04220 (plasmid) [Phaeobacter inhibens]|uniref:DUF3560 domain-containing protein n=1 Tax=Phaeobacter inhibens TaxID=221822 RepID=UPI000C9C1B21|nr:DUF3560 domain-containing protein [Phaeobacter inhibens]AUQ92778.1 hypothetical protein PhaeoP24_04220 [Phaeobacter inhibens]